MKEVNTCKNIIGNGTKIGHQESKNDNGQILSHNVPEKTEAQREYAAKVADQSRWAA